MLPSLFHRDGDGAGQRRGLAVSARRTGVALGADGASRTARTTIALRTSRASRAGVALVALGAVLDERQRAVGVHQDRAAQGILDGVELVGRGGGGRRGGRGDGRQRDRRDAHGDGGDGGRGGGGGGRRQRVRGPDGQREREDEQRAQERPEPPRRRRDHHGGGRRDGRGGGGQRRGLRAPGRVVVGEGDAEAVDVVQLRVLVADDVAGGAAAEVGGGDEGAGKRSGHD